jgi:hypothetical protein
MKIVELKIDDTAFSGVDAVALVESPAIETDFIAFNKVNMAEMTYNDYPQAAVDAARRGIELNEKNNMKCATQVGKVRAQQLVNGEKLSLDTIKRMRAFLIRQKGNYELAIRRKDYNACGYISYLLWGGEAALPWAEKKLRQAGIEFSKFGDALLPSNIPQMAPNEPINFEGLEDACQRGYKAIGLKEKDGRMVPNCVPIENFEEELIEEIIKDSLNINVFGYPTEYFYMCPGAIATFKHLISMEVDEDTKGMIRSAALIADNIFDLEEDVIEEGIAMPEDVEVASLLISDFKDLMLEIDEITGMTHDVSYMDDHLQTIVSYAPEAFNINVNALPNFVNEASTGKRRNFAAELQDKQMLVGPLMTPGKLIPRIDEETGEEYQVFFSKETIEKIAYKMMQDKLVDSVNIEHDGAHRVDDAYLVETWIVKDPEADKSVLYGFLPVTGQWYGMYKIDNRRIWNEYVKTGKVKGFSVEGYFLNNILTYK